MTLTPGGYDEAVAEVERLRAALSEVEAERDRLREERPAFTAAEAEAVAAFFSYGATRGNHSGEGGRGPSPGPLTEHINAMGEVARKLWPLMSAPSPEGPREPPTWGETSRPFATHGHVGAACGCEMTLYGKDIRQRRHASVAFCPAHTFADLVSGEAAIRQAMEKGEPG